MPIGNDRQQEMAKLYEKMCYRYSRYEVWQDMVYMVATAISNTVEMKMNAPMLRIQKNTVL